MKTFFAAMAQSFPARYKDKIAIGSGSNGMVYCYLDKQTKRKVAVKEMFTGNGCFEDIKKEKLILEELDSRHIVKLIDHIEDKKENVYRLVMEYCSGGSLDKRGRLNDNELLIVAEHILNGLAHMHSKGFIHRDIKPANLLYCDDQKEPIYKLGDVGESKNIAQSIKTRRGTFKFMAPEVKNLDDSKLKQIKNGKCKYYDQSADIWSFGATLLALGEGEHCIIQSRPKFKKIKNPKLKMLIARCLVDDPTQRWSVHMLQTLSNDTMIDLLLKQKFNCHIDETKIEKSCELLVRCLDLSKETEKKIRTSMKEMEWVQLKNIKDKWSTFYNDVRCEYAWWLMKKPEMIASNMNNEWKKTQLFILKVKMIVDGFKEMIVKSDKMEQSCNDLMHQMQHSNSKKFQIIALEIISACQIV